MSNDITKINIKHLVLDGFDNIDQGRLEESIQQQLHHLVFQQDAISPAKDASITNVPGGQFTLNDGTTMDTLGGQIAGAIHESIINVK